MLNALDFNALATNYGQTHARFSSGDFNYDGDVTSLDFNLLASKFGSRLDPPMSSLPLARSPDLQNLFGDNKSLTSDPIVA